MHNEPLNQSITASLEYLSLELLNIPIFDLFDGSADNIQPLGGDIPVSFQGRYEGRNLNLRPRILGNATGIVFSLARHELAKTACGQVGENRE